MNSSLRALVLLVACATAAAAQAANEHPLVIPLPEAAGFVSFQLVTTRAARDADAPTSLPDLQAALVPQALPGERNTIHRVLSDAAGNFVFGYDLTVEVIGPARKFKVCVRPLSPEFEQQLRARRRGDRAAQAPLGATTLPRAPDAQTLDDGDAFALDLLVNAQTGVRVTDLVKVAVEAPRPRHTAPRDFTVESVALALKDFRVTVNGEPTTGGGRGRTCTGALVWFYLPGRGRFIFSLTPRDGYDFQKIGLIEDSKLSFDFHGEHYEWVSSAPVTGQPGSWYVWVLHDPTYTPEVAAPAELDARGAAKYEDPSALKDVLNGRAPRTGPRVGYSVKNPRAEIDRQSPPRVRVGAADRMENLLPKR